MATYLSISRRNEGYGGITQPHFQPRRPSSSSFMPLPSDTRQVQFKGHVVMDIRSIGAAVVILIFEVSLPFADLKTQVAR
jgi:hypothetical protein